MDQETEMDEPLSRLAHDFAPRQPALAITFARAAIASNPDRDFDNEILLDVIRDARVDLDLEPEGDPAEALFDWIEERTQRKEKTHAENREIERLSGKLEETLAALDEKKLALRQTVQALGQVGAELEKTRFNKPDLREFFCLTRDVPHCLHRHRCLPLLCLPQRIQTHLLQAMQHFYQTA